MCNMSRKSKSEYIAEKRRAYGNAGKPKRSRILDAIECKSCKEVMACHFRPGDTQIGTVAHYGGDTRGDFFWTLAQTDRNMQRAETTTTWNRGIHNTVSALKRLERRFPVPITAGHEDNGPKPINYAMAEMQGRCREVLVSGLDITSDTPEGNSLRANLLKWLAATP